MKLDVRAFALSCSILWGLGLFLLTWWVILFEGTGGELGLIGHVYRGYSVSAAGSLIGRTGVGARRRPYRRRHLRVAL